MAITQKVVKEQIDSSEKMISDTVVELEDLLEEIRKMRDGSTNIDPQKDKSLIEKIDEYNGLNQTLQYYTGHLNALEWTLNEMKSKSKSRRKKEKDDE